MSVEEVAARSAAAADRLEAVPVSERVAWMRAVAGAIDAEAEALVPIADDETHLGVTRLFGEVARTSGQLRHLAAAAAEGSCFEVVIDHADTSLTPPRPDLRRMLRPVGPVAVFAAGNFPLAFSVLGADTAAAWAAGCPVVVKAHPGHPDLSRATVDVARSALSGAGGDPDLLLLVESVEEGRDLLRHRLIRAGAFTGSTAGGRALLDIVMSRPDPIPFYGELGSTNPVVVLPGAARTRAEQIADGLVGSYTLGLGQFCTKPGVVLVPAGSELLDAVRVRAGAVPGGRLLTGGITEAYARGVDALERRPGVRVEGPRHADAWVGGEANTTEQASGAVAVRLVTVGVEALLADPDAFLETEYFGPLTVLVEYEHLDQVNQAIALLRGSLTGTVHFADDAGDHETAGRLVDLLARRCGRVIANGWPTGVAVTWAMHHGGPWPATTASLFSSVGAMSIRRFLTPVCFQDVPSSMLPEALRDGASGPRRVDGVLA